MLETGSFDLVIIWEPQFGPPPSNYFTNTNNGHDKQRLQRFGHHRSWRGKQNFNELIAFNAVIKQQLNTMLFAITWREI